MGNDAVIDILEPRTMECLIDGNSGIYVPQKFVENFDLSVWQGISKEDTDILLAGPNHEHYWEAWDTILSSAFHIDKKGKRWTLYQDSDLFAVPENYDWDNH